MSANKSQFLVSVADAILRDKTTDQVVMKGKALINASMKQAISQQEVRGGFGDALQFIYMHGKKLDFSLESCTFDEGYIAINNNTSIVTGLKDFYIIDEVITLTAGAGSVAQTPVGNLYVQKADGSYVTVTPTVKAFTVAGGAATTVKVSYRYNTSVDNITIDAGSFPHSYELTLSCKIFEGIGQTAECQITVPEFLPNGNCDISLTSAGVSTSKLEGSALANASDNAYAYINIRPIGATSTSYTAIAATPSAVSISSGSPTSQLTVYGLRSGLYSNVVITSDCTYVSGTPATCTVGAGTGLITRVATGSSVITITHTASGFTDTVVVTSA